MSFSEEIRATGNFQRQFQKEKRRIQLSEVPKTDIDTLQTHVVDVRTQIHFSNVPNIRSNINDVPVGPHQYILEPDYKSVRIRTKFPDVHGTGEYASHSHTVDGNFNIYNVLRIYDQAGVSGQKLWYYILAESPDPPNTDHFFDHLWKWGVGVHPTIPPYMVFDGITGDLACGNDSSLWSQPLTKFSISLWIYPTAVTDGVNREVFDHGSGSGHGFECEIDDATAGQIRFRVNNSIGTAFTAASTALIANHWQHITCVYDNSLGSANVKIYVNAVLGATTADLTETVNASANMELASPSNDFKGRMRDVRWWTNRALTSSEVADVRNNSSSAPTPDYWLKMDEGDGDPFDFITGTKKATGIDNVSVSWGKGMSLLPKANSLALNENDGDGTHFLRADAPLTSNYNFTTTNFSLCFWINPFIVTGGTSDTVAYRFSTSSNNWFIELDSSSDSKLWARMEIGGTVVAKREFPVPLAVNQWYFVVLTWDSQAQVLKLKVNDEDDATTGKGSSTPNSIDGIFFGGFPDVSSDRVFRGYLTGITYYQHQPSIQFDGTNDFVDCGNHASLWSQSLTKFSFSFWIYPTAGWDTNARTVVDHGVGAAQGFGVLIDASVTGRIRFNVKDAINGSNNANNDTLVLNQWNFVTCVYDNSLATGNVKCYVNGVVGTNDDLTESINQNVTLTLSQSTTDFQGFMQGFQWWTSKALSAKEVSDLYNLQYTGPEPNYWLPMLDGDISTNATRTQDIVEPLKNKYATFSGAVWATGKGRILSDPEKTNLFKYNTITPTRTPLAYGDGQYGLTPASLSFDGVNDYLQCGNHTDLWSQGLNKFSMSFWIYPTAMGGGTIRMIVHQGTGPNEKICELDGTTSGKIVFQIKDSGSVFRVASSLDVVLNQWNFITCVYDNSLVSANIKVYVNAVLGSVTGDLTEVINEVENLRIGEDSNDFQGQLQDFRWWNNVALSQWDITNLYSNDPYATNFVEQMDYWLPMNEGTGNPVDKIGGKTATLNNGATWSTNRH